MTDLRSAKCSCCLRPMSGPRQEVGFCSIECACYAGRFSVTKGPINQDQPIKMHPPKQSWWMQDEEYERWCNRLGWTWSRERGWHVEDAALAQLSEPRLVSGRPEFDSQGRPLATRC